MNDVITYDYVLGVVYPYRGRACIHMGALQRNVVLLYLRITQRYEYALLATRTNIVVLDKNCIPCYPGIVVIRFHAPR